MKIQNEQNIGVSQDAQVTQASRPDNIKSVQELSPGERFKATVTDIQQGQVTIRLDSGQTLTAKSLVLPEARIGEDSIFLVTENFKGQILLEMIRPDNGALKSGLIRDALAGAGQSATMENIELVRALMDNQLPIDGETIQKALFFKYAQGEKLSLNKILFLIEENFPADKMNIDLLNNLMERQVGLKENLSSLLFEMMDIPDGALQKQLFSRLIEGGEAGPKNESISSEREPFLLPGRDVQLEIFGDKEKNGFQPEKRTETINKVKESIYFRLDEKKTVEDLRRYFKDMYETVKDMEKILKKTETMTDAKPEAVLQRLTAVRESLEFMNHVGQYRDFIQIPFTYANRENEGELIIFKNPGKQVDYKKQASVLIGLDYAYLGRVEVFISKLQNTLNLQFRLGQDETLRILNQNFHKLAVGLSEKGYLVTGVSFKKLTQPFRLTDRDERQKKEEAVSRRYSFDMRV